MVSSGPVAGNGTVLVVGTLLGAGELGLFDGGGLGLPEGEGFVAIVGEGVGPWGP